MNISKYDITYRCGHQETVKICGRKRDRERQVESMKQDLCPACSEADFIARAKIAAEKNKDLPKLIGSPKRIMRAEIIRAEKLANADQLGQDPTSEKIISEWKNQTDASWWLHLNGRTLEDDIRGREWGDTK